MYKVNHFNGYDHIKKVSADNKRVILIGDFILNQFFHGSAISVAKDAPIPIINVSKVELAPGASGIITEVLRRFRVKVIPIGLVGRDVFGIWLRKRLTDGKIYSNNLLTDSKIKTPSASRVISNSIQVTRFDQTIQYDLNSTHEQRLLKIIEKEIRNTSLVIIADYGYGTISKRIADKVLEEVKKRKINLFVSSVGQNYLKYNDPKTIIKINTPDSLLLIKDPGNYKLEPSEILYRLHDVLEADRILLTREQQGIAIYDNGVITEKPATRDERVDVKGIGEVMTATICSRLLYGKNFVDSCELGNVAAGLAVSSGHIENISKREIIKAKKEYDEWLNQK